MNSGSDHFNILSGKSVDGSQVSLDKGVYNTGETTTPPAPVEKAFGLNAHIRRVGGLKLKCHTARLLDTRACVQATTFKDYYTVS